MTLANALAQTAILPGFLAFVLFMWGVMESRTWAKVLGVVLVLIMLGLIAASIWVQV